MDILTKDEVETRGGELAKKITEGAIFIHPTDTIYGLGCNATDDSAVNKLREIKEKTTTVSVWVPSKEWIQNNCEVDDKAQEWINKLPGPYTLVLKLKNKNAVSQNINTKGDGTIGVRIPDHWLHSFVERLDTPIVTTSANKAGEDFMTNEDNLNSDIKRKTSFMIYEGEKDGAPSKLVKLI